MYGTMNINERKCGHLIFMAVRTPILQNIHIKTYKTATNIRVSKYIYKYT